MAQLTRLVLPSASGEATRRVRDPTLRDQGLSHSHPLRHSPRARPSSARNAPSVLSSNEIGSFEQWRGRPRPRSATAGFHRMNLPCQPRAMICGEKDLALHGFTSMDVAIATSGCPPVTRSPRLSPEELRAAEQRPLGPHRAPYSRYDLPFYSVAGANIVELMVSGFHAHSPRRILSLFRRRVHCARRLPFALLAKRVAVHARKPREEPNSLPPDRTPRSAETSTAADGRVSAGDGRVAARDPAGAVCAAAP
eukprot:5926771-Prymnesium_polylepis.1